jgi:hypothetical protein
MNVEQWSVLRCPHCGHAKRERMPSDACQFFYDCKNCQAVLRPLPADCCVFCSFGTVKCPPMQMHAASDACGCAALASGRPDCSGGS